MKVVAQYSFTTQTNHAAAPGQLITLDSMVHEWLNEKGRIDEEGWRFVDFHDGRRADLIREEMKVADGEGTAWIITEPTANGRFRTSIRLGYLAGEGLGVSCTLQAGNSANVLMPVQVEAHCPKIVRRIVSLPLAWKVRDSDISPTPLRCYGEEGGRGFLSLLRSSSRALPIIAVSQQRGLLLQPDISRAMAEDLIGLAIVAELDDGASWEVTKAIGREFSCYMGAIRIYWPFGPSETDPYRHPLWTPQRLLQNVGTTIEAATQLREQIKRLLFELSALSIEPPALFEKLRVLSQGQAAAAKKTRPDDSAEYYKAMMEEFEKDNDLLRAELGAERENLRQLRADLYNFQIQQAWRGGGTAQLLPDNAEPPATVADAVERAKLVHAQFLTFGSDVEEGIRSIGSSAGPPDKVLTWLGKLAELVASRRQGPIGRSMVDWLTENGCSASGESETVRNNKTDMGRRTWHDGRGSREFHLHMKPCEATHPDRCVRIYFDWDDASEKIVVGWVGRHP